MGNRGFTLIELLIVIAIVCNVAIFVLLEITIIMGNQWYTEAGALKQIQVEHPTATEIIDTQRNLWKYSVITVKEKGVSKTYYLDSNIFFNYEIHEKK